MRSKQWQFWSYIVRRLARSQGFLDPVAALSQLQRFAQPSEVWVPTELLRFGAVLQVRGLINSQAIQHNRDWLWPYWVKRQFDPDDVSFIPRAFSLAHINLTHRNWTALGLPDVDSFSLVDPRGLVTPFYDGWSLDSWVISESGPVYFPAASTTAQQGLANQPGVCVETSDTQSEIKWKSSAEITVDADEISCCVRYSVTMASKGWLVIGVRPYNPEGVSFVDKIEHLTDSDGWRVNGKQIVRFSQKPQQLFYSDYGHGDICHQTVRGENASDTKDIHCSVGMATSAAMFAVKPNEMLEITSHIPLAKRTELKVFSASTWEQSLAGTCQLQIPDAHMKFLYDTAIKMLVLHSPGDIYPGPFTYRRFWFRDAVFIMEALLSVGLIGRVEKVLEGFPSKQTVTGHLLSQNGEWDSNGQGIWIIRRYCEIANLTVDPKWIPMLKKAAHWIQRKRVMSKETTPHQGLLPAGFSAEHLGPNDYYYWDDFWSLAGLKSQAWLMKHAGDTKAAEAATKDANDLEASIQQSLQSVAQRLGHSAIPASPYRRMDAGAIGSIVAGYPLQLWAADDSRLIDTVNYLLNFCFLRGGFYQEISHSGINAYLTLHVAQVLLRAGDPRFYDIVQAIGALASGTGQWPEAIHPRTGGGCMGDGMHVWASAEWTLIVRNMFVREESEENKLILLSGIPKQWFASSEEILFGPVYTRFGRISLKIHGGKGPVRLEWTANWHTQAPALELRLMGMEPVLLDSNSMSTEFKRPT